MSISGGSLYAYCATLLFGCWPLRWPSHRRGQQPKMYVKPEAAITVFELLMMGGVSPETCWAIKKHRNNKFYYTVASCWLFLWVLYYDAWIHEHQVFSVSVTHLGIWTATLPATSDRICYVHRKASPVPIKTFENDSNNVSKTPHIIKHLTQNCVWWVNAALCIVWCARNMSIFDILHRDV